MATSAYVNQRGAGWLRFAGIMILIVGTLNVIWGIAAVDGSRFFVGDTKFILGDLSNWGVAAITIGTLQIFAAVSVWRGGLYGAIVGIVMAVASAIAALLSLPAYPLWSLAVFGVDVLIIYGLTTYGARGR